MRNICPDDEEFYLRKEQSIISDYMTEKGYEYNIDLFLSGKVFLESENTEQYDIAFLDILVCKVVLFIIYWCVKYCGLQCFARAGSGQSSP